MAVITLTLLLPGKSVPVQSWTFDGEPLIRVGRAADNDVVLYSAVVSRHHLEIRLEEGGWEACNLGANGTYVDGQSITKQILTDGVVVRLASSGPKIQIAMPSALSPEQRELMQQEEAARHHRAHAGSARDTIISPH